MGARKEYTTRKLTTEEQEFASRPENHNLIFKYMNIKRLDPEEFYDELIIDYLVAVKQYVTERPWIQEKFDFEPILFQRLNGAMMHYYRAKNVPSRKPEGGFISLDYTVEGDNPFAENTPNYINEMLVDDKQAVEQIVLDTVMIQEIMEGLTEQQQTIFRLMLEGYTKTEIVKALSINFKTINIELDSVKDSVKRCISR
jgi:DNA-directed RNA polymerase specialized sigma24 family protein